jgi:hypothetical protein
MPLHHSHFHWTEFGFGFDGVLLLARSNVLAHSASLRQVWGCQWWADSPRAILVVFASLLGIRIVIGVAVVADTRRYLVDVFRGLELWADIFKGELSSQFLLSGFWYRELRLGRWRSQEISVEIGGCLRSQNTGQKWQWGRPELFSGIRHNVTQSRRSAKMLVENPQKKQI